MSLRVQEVLAPGGGTVSWTVVDECFEPVAPVESFLAHLEAIERSPNTVRAYASSLRLFFEFLSGRDAVWDEVGLDELGRFASWLRRPSDEVVIPIDASLSARSASTVNRHLAAVFAFYDFHSRFGVPVASELVDWRRGGRGAYRPFLEGIGGRSRKTARRPVRLRTPRRLPMTLSPEQIAAVLAACEHLRDRLLIGLLAETGMRVGQALGLRHRDFVSRETTIRIVPRSDNANGARAKCRNETAIPVSAALARLYSDYLFDEYGDVDSDYVFVNLFAPPVGRPLGYSAVAGLVDRLRARSGIDFSLHVLRHSAASEWIRSGVPIEVVSELLTHANVATTSGTYVHLGVEDLRAALERAGLR